MPQARLAPVRTTCWLPRTAVTPSAGACTRRTNPASPPSCGHPQRTMLGSRASLCQVGNMPLLPEFPASDYLGSMPLLPGVVHPPSSKQYRLHSSQPVTRSPACCRTLHTPAASSSTGLRCHFGCAEPVPKEHKQEAPLPSDSHVLRAQTMWPQSTPCEMRTACT